MSIKIAQGPRRGPEQQDELDTLIWDTPACRPEPRSLVWNPSSFPTWRIRRAEERGALSDEGGRKGSALPRLPGDHKGPQISAGELIAASRRCSASLPLQSGGKGLRLRQREGLRRPGPRPGPRPGSLSSKNYNSQQPPPAPARSRGAEAAGSASRRPGERAGRKSPPAGSRPCRSEAQPPAGPGARPHRVSDSCTHSRRALPRDRPAPPPSHPAASCPWPSDSEERSPSSDGRRTLHAPLVRHLPDRLAGLLLALPSAGHQSLPTSGTHTLSDSQDTSHSDSWDPHPLQVSGHLPPLVRHTSSL